MSHIDNITRATKAYHILAQATNYQLNLTKMIDRLYMDSEGNTIGAAFKALTGKNANKAPASTHRLIREFTHALGITGNSYSEKFDQLNEFGRDRAGDRASSIYEHEISGEPGPYMEARQ